MATLAQNKLDLAAAEQALRDLVTGTRISSLNQGTHGAQFETMGEAGLRRHIQTLEGTIARQEGRSGGRGPIRMVW